MPAALHSLPSLTFRTFGGMADGTIAGAAIIAGVRMADGTIAGAAITGGVLTAIK